MIKCVIYYKNQDTPLVFINFLNYPYLLFFKKLFHIRFYYHINSVHRPIQIKQIFMYSVQCIKCLKPLIIYLKFWAILPKYNFKSKKIHSTRLCECIAIFLFGVVFSLSGFSITFLFLETSVQFSNSEPIVKYSAILYEILGIMCCFCSLYDVMTKRSSWEQFFQKISSIEESEYLCCTNQETKNVLRTPIFWFVFLNTQLLGGYVIHFLIYFDEDYKLVYLTFVSQMIFSYENMLMSFTVATLALNLKSKFKCINNTLEISFDSEQKKLNFQKVKQTKKLYLEMTRIMDLFNSLFGRQMFFMPLVCSVQVLHTSLLISLLGQEDLWSYVPLHCAYAMFLMLMQFSQMFCCDIAMRESEKILVTCYNIQDQFPVYAPQHEEMQDLTTKLVNKKIKFTALNYFDVDRSTMFAMIGNTVMYFVALVQFVHKPYDKKIFKG